MIYLAAVAGVVTAGLLFQIHTLQNMLLKQAAMFAAERAELLTRIQHPEMIPTLTGSSNYQDAEPPDDDFARVGHVWDPEDG